MAKRELTRVMKIMAPGGKATPGPPLGPALGAAGVNPGQFIQQFNAATADKGGLMMGCIIKVYSDRTFEFELRSSPASALLKKAAGVEKGSGTPQDRAGGKVTREQVRAIAQEKLADLNTADVEAAMLMVEGTARSMGIVVEG
ncbi:MAG: 50S ribosomal protein L11 [Phycisphaerales bacterium]